MFGATAKWRSSWLYLSPENAIITVNYNSRTIARREPLIRHDLPYRRAAEHDLTCESGIRHFGTDFSRKSETTVAGIPVVIWRRSLGNGSEEQYLAPSLDCMPLKTYKILKNQWWLPTFIDSFEASSVQFGEPAADLFALPSGYRQIENPERAGLIRTRLGPKLGRRRSRPCGPAAVFDLGDSGGSDIAANKDAMIAEAFSLRRRSPRRR